MPRRAAAPSPSRCDGSVPASAIIEDRSSGSGRSPPRSTSIFCIAIWPRAPTARDRPFGLRADVLVVDAHRSGDRRLGRQQQGRVGGDLLPQIDLVGGGLVEHRLAVVEKVVTASRTSGTDVVAVEALLQVAVVLRIELGRSPGPVSPSAALVTMAFSRAAM